MKSGRLFGTTWHIVSQRSCLGSLLTPCALAIEKRCEGSLLNSRKLNILEQAM